MSLFFCLFCKGLGAVLWGCGSPNHGTCPKMIAPSSAPANVCPGDYTVLGSEKKCLCSLALLKPNHCNNLIWVAHPH